MKYVPLPAVRLLVLSIAVLIVGKAFADERNASNFEEFADTVVPAREAEITPIVSGWLNRNQFCAGPVCQRR